MGWVWGGQDAPLEGGSTARGDLLRREENRNAVPPDDSFSLRRSPFLKQAISPLGFPRRLSPRSDRRPVLFFSG